MQLKRGLLLVAAFALGTGADDALAAGFDCAVTSLRPAERQVCATPVLSALDDALGPAYRRVRVQDPSAPASQRRWLEKRNRCSDHACLLLAYETRLAVLRRQVDTCPIAEAALVGHWIARSGGGAFDELEFTRTGSRRTFTSWLHHAPFSTGTWSFRDCAIQVDGSGRFDVDLTVIDFRGSRLRLATDLDDSPVDLLKR
ncbi:MAG TPA: hypothetical protein VF457_07085 [Burkholderiaceae bacterium]